MLEISSGWHTERGRRTANQDAVLSTTLPGGRELAAVADGMGGHSAGEVASRTALEELAAGLSRGLTLTDAVSAANDALRAAAHDHPEWAGMGTTVVTLLRAGDDYRIANVGDSRAYRITAAEITQLTIDHSVVAEASRVGGSAAEAALDSRWRHALTRAVGTDASVQVDVFGPFSAAEPHAVLLCSDGLYRSMRDDRIRDLVMSASDPGAAARALVAEAYDNGSGDNITAAVVRFLAPLAEPAVRAANVPLTKPRVPHHRRHRRQPLGAPAIVELTLIALLLALVVVLLVRTV